MFFSGAGISTPAGLPLFKGLVDQIYAALNTHREDVEDVPYQRGQYDATLDQLERRYPGERLAVRTVIPRILEPKWRRRGATATHEALLQLSTGRKGATRLVTTNFDRIFQRVIDRRKLDVPCLSAPLLPIPKPSRWHGVVHLHGLLPKRPDDVALNRLVLSSGDFGLAYLTERWASRFVSELFRYYTVCFVGYAINDPVMRYMMDALAADELLGEKKPQAYAFAGFREDETKATKEWKSKGVTPLLYKIPAGMTDHSALHKTLKEWAATYRDGVHGKEMIVAQHASTPPLTSSRYDFAVGRMLWALSDDAAAKHFADFEPLPPLEWLDPMCSNQFHYEDLPQFGVAPNELRDKDLSFSFICRPSPYTYGPWMSLVVPPSHAGHWDEVMSQIACWLIRHLNNPKLVIWLANNGGKLNDNLLLFVRNRIEDIDKNRAKSAEPGSPKSEERILEVADPMRVLWRLFLAGRVRSQAQKYSFHDWIIRFASDGLVPTLRFELREILAPCVVLREPFRPFEELRDREGAERVNDLVSWELRLAGGHVHTFIRDLAKNPNWQAALPSLLRDFSALLQDALDLTCELQGADRKSDHTYVAQPSISEHSQNRRFHDWTALIDLTRDAWTATADRDPRSARDVAGEWLQIPYPLFKRLSFFAACNGDVISSSLAVDWLLSDQGWWLWSAETKREAIRLLVSLGSRLEEPEGRALEQAILEGPPRSMYVADLDSEQWTRIVDQDVWLRLAKLQSASRSLGSEAEARLNEFRSQHPDWKLAEDQSDEFTFWMSDGGEWRKYEQTPRHRRELMQWLKEHQRSDFWEEDDWRDRCRKDFPTTATTLCGLAREGIWPAERWREALQAWAEEPLLRRSWRYLARLVSEVPESAMSTIIHSFSWWVKAQSATFEGQEDIFFHLVRRIFDLDGEDAADEDEQPVSRAINHPIGHATEAVLKWWYRQEPKDGDGLRAEIRDLFTELCDTHIQKYRHGRVLLAAHVIALFRVDKAWATDHLLPLFKWQDSVSEARGAWDGFLWTPRLYQPLMVALKDPFLETARHYSELGKYAEQYASFLTFAALDPGDVFTVKELADTTRQLPAAGLHDSMQTLVRALESAAERRAEYWRNRVLPYIRNIWPKSNDLITPGISESVARLCIAAQDAFPEAMKEMRHWLQPIGYPDFLVHLMVEADLCEQYPSGALEFLTVIVGDNAQWPARELSQCLGAIEQAGDDLGKDPRFIRLRELQS